MSGMRRLGEGLGELHNWGGASVHSAHSQRDNRSVWRYKTVHNFISLAEIFAFYCG